MNLSTLVRPNILTMKPYSSARDEYEGAAEVFLDANENPFNNGLNRYPDPLQRSLKKQIAALKGLSAESIFLGNGSDEAIDLLIRIFCEPGEDNILITSPTYGMYAVCASIQNIAIKDVPLSESFELQDEKVLGAIDEKTKLIFLCSPNNPSGNLLKEEAVVNILRGFRGIVVLDEAYIDFANTPGFLSRLSQFSNLVVLQTFSKAWGLAGLRLGMCFASTDIIGLMNKVKYPYNINVTIQEIALEKLSQPDQVQRQITMLNSQREWMRHELRNLPMVIMVYPSDANFLLVKVTDARGLYARLLERGIIVRDRSRVKRCEDCLRITIGTVEENQKLIKALSA
jgi:histidinol-phosphate aminotransferase